MRYYVTFGVKYRYEPHPAGSWVTPDGVLEVVNLGTSNFREMEARNAVFHAIGPQWAFLYERPEISPMYPLGVVARLDAQTGEIEVLT